MVQIEARKKFRESFCKAMRTDEDELKESISRFQKHNIILVSKP